jgi:endoglucanase
MRALRSLMRALRSLMRAPRQYRRRAGRPGLAATSAAIASLCLVLPAAACSSGGHADVKPRTAATDSQARGPIAHDKIYDYPDPRLHAAVTTLKAQGHGAEAAELAALGAVPSGLWAAGQTGEMQVVRSVSLAAAKADAVPVIVAYNLPDRDSCGKFSADYGPSRQGYMAWIRQLAAAIGTAHDIVIVEPDGLPDIVRACLDPAQAAERYQLLRYAMRQLGALPNAHVYLDAGNPGMFPSPAQLVGPLKRAGIQYGRGFSANVSNFAWTSVMVAWSQQLERALGGHADAVIDTSRNGNGPYTGPDAPQWCNPPERASGPTPQIDPGPTGIDAYLWIKDPGISDGSCNGGPAAGQFYTQYAVTLAQTKAGIQ